ncbi:MAG: ABC transporter permease [Planctomycetes bacterium]|nr:ABC transporter permease [Planctomycetota bacterium]MCC7170158.1 ABC transporter permease [Planctomycetota bacterium]
MLAILEAWGVDVQRRCGAFLRDLQGIGEILGRIVTSTLGMSSGARRLLRRHIGMQIYFTGVQAVPVAGLLAFLVGYGFGQLIATNQIFFLIPIFLDRIILQNVAPLIAAIVVVARTSSAVAVELGNMTVAREVEMLEGFGIDPYRHLALPRLFGIVVGTMCLTLIVAAIAMLSLFSVMQEYPQSGGIDLLLKVSPSTGSHLVALGLAYGIVIAIVALRQGFGLDPYFTEVPKAASRAVIKSIVMCAVASALVSVMAG